MVISYRSAKTVVKGSPIEGRGLFAAAPIAAGEIVAVKGGHVFNRETLERVQPALGPAEIQIGEDLFIGPLDASEREGSMIFSNHSCEPNLGLAGQVIFVALRDIEAGEELTHDWAMPTTIKTAWSAIAAPRRAARSSPARTGAAATSRRSTEASFPGTSRKRSGRWRNDAG